MANNYTDGIFQGSQSVSLTVDLYPLPDVITPASGNLSVYYFRQGAAAAVQIAPVAILLNDPYTSGGWIKVDEVNIPGAYRLDLPNAAFAAGADFVKLRVYAEDAEGNPYVYNETFRLIDKAAYLADIANAVDDTLSASHGAANWESGDNLSGAFTLTVNLTLDTIPVAGVNVTVRRDANPDVDFSVKATDGGGQAVFSLPNGNYTILVVTGFTYAPVNPIPVVINNGNEIENVALTLADENPSSPDRCLIKADVINNRGLPASGIQFKITLVATGTMEVPNDIFLQAIEINEATDANGRLRVEVVRSNLIVPNNASSTDYHIQCGVLGLDITETLDMAVFDLGVFNTP